jgi:hypothetical protein
VTEALTPIARCKVPNLGLVMKAADLVTVGSIAEEPWCVDSTRPPSEFYCEAVTRGFDWLPVRDDDKLIRRVVQTSHLEELASFGEVKNSARKLGVEDLVGADAPILSVLDRLQDRPFLFCLGGKDVDGIVTRYDINQPAAHYFGLALAIVIEAAIGQAIDYEYAGSDAAIADAARRSQIGGKRLAAWLDNKQSSTQSRLLNQLSLGDKIEILKLRGSESLVAKCSDLYARSGDIATQLFSDLGQVKQLRDAVAHELPTLADTDAMFHRLRVAHSLAHILAADE